MTELFKKFLRGLLYLRENLNTDTKKRILGYGCALLILVLSLCTITPITGPMTDNSSGASGPTDSSTALPIDPEAGRVRLFTCDKALYSAFAQLSYEYTRATGVQVLVLTPQEGESCQEALQRLLQAGNMPNIFCMHSAEDVKKWDSRLYDLAGSPLLDTLCAPEFALQSGDRTLAIAADVEGYGLIYNAALLAKAGFTRSDIQSYTDLSTVSQFITEKKLRFSAFTAPAFTDPGQRGLGNLLLDAVDGADSLRTLWDLYIHNDGADTGSQGLRQFQGGFSVFYVGGSWEYGKLEMIGTQNLDILPLFYPDGGAMGYQVTLAWGIDKLAEETDIQASQDFLGWLVTAPEGGRAPADSLGLLMPFRQVAYYADPLEKKLRSYMGSEAARVSWLELHTADLEHSQSLGQALSRYHLQPDEESWQAVLDALQFG